MRGLTVAVQLQTPTRRIVLPSRLDGSGDEKNRSSDGGSGGEGSSGISPKDIEPCGGVDAIVSRRLEEVGQHILRVEVGYLANGAKTLRKFYRFNVTVPLNITETVTRSGDATCLVSITVENVMEKQGNGGGAVTISSVGFEPPAGLVAKKISLDSDNQNDFDDSIQETSYLAKRRSAIDLYDSCGRLEPGDSYRYLFSVNAESEAAALRGIACGDELGQALIYYHKVMGESGKIYSSTVVCPPTSFLSGEQGGARANSNSAQSSTFVVHRSGLSVDVAAASAQRSSSGRMSDGQGSLDELLPVTVEPIDPPSNMTLSLPEKVTLLVVNHSSQTMNLQLQMRLPNMSGVVICGPSFISIGEVPPSGGSCTVDVRLVALVAGLFPVQGCYIIDLTTGMEIQQPALFNVFVELPGGEEKKTMDDLIDF